MSQPRRDRPARALVAAAMIGLADVLEGEAPARRPVIETSPSERGDPIDLLLDPHDPRLTVAFVRPWLCRHRTPGS